MWLIETDSVKSLEIMYEMAKKGSLHQVKPIPLNVLKGCCFSWHDSNGVWQWQGKTASVHLAAILLYALKRPLLTQFYCTLLQKTGWKTHTLKISSPLSGSQSSSFLSQKGRQMKLVVWFTQFRQKCCISVPKKKHTKKKVWNIWLSLHICTFWNIRTFQNKAISLSYLWDCGL